MTTDQTTASPARVETTTTAIAIGTATGTAITNSLPALMTMACGLLVLFCVGLLQTPAVHNGAHDTRHANGFPCH